MLLFLFLLISQHSVETTISGCHSDRDKDHLFRVSCVSQGLAAVPDGIDPGTQVLVLSQNVFVSLSWSSYTTFTHLQELDLSQNLISTIDSSGPVLEYLRVLRLSDNKLTSLGRATFNSTPSLMEVYLDGNSISSLHTATFNNLPLLELINLSRNKLHFLPTHLLQNISSRNLKNFDLENNQIQYLPDHFFSVKPDIPYVFLSKNLWVCTCQVSYLQQYLEDQGHNIYTHTGPSSIENDLESVVCSVPLTLQGRAIVDLNEEEYCASDTDPQHSNTHTPTTALATTIIQPNIMKTLPPTTTATTIQPTTPNPAESSTTPFLTTSTTDNPPTTTPPTSPPSTTPPTSTPSTTQPTTTPPTTTTPTSTPSTTPPTSTPSTTPPTTTTTTTTPTTTPPTSTSTTTPPTSTPSITQPTTTPPTTTTTTTTTPTTTPPTTTTPTTTPPTTTTTTTTLTPTPPTTTPTTTEPNTTTTPTFSTPTGTPKIAESRTAQPTGGVRSARSGAQRSVIWCWWLFITVLLLCIFSAIFSCMLFLWLVIIYIRLYRPIKRQVYGGQRVTLRAYQVTADTSPTVDTTEEERVLFLTTDMIRETRPVFRSVLFISKRAEDERNEGTRDEDEEKKRGSDAVTKIDLLPAVTLRREQTESKDREEVFRKTFYRLISREEEIEGWREVEENCWKMTEREKERREGGVERLKARYSLILREETGSVMEGSKGEAEWLVGEWEMRGGNWGSLIRMKGGCGLSDSAHMVKPEPEAETSG